MSAQGQQPPIYIGVFGGPRAGKTSFIREVIAKNTSRLHLPPTTDVQIMKPVAIDGRQVVLVDTPAFYNRAARDLDSADVLKRLAGFMVRMQENGHPLSAIVFIHPHSNGPKTPWLVGDSQRNLPIVRQIIGDGFLPNMIFTLTGWSNPPTPDQLSRDHQARAQEPFRTHVQRVNWSSGPSPHGALDIIRMAMRRQPRQLALQHELIDRRIRLADTAAGKIVTQNAKQIAQQLRSHGDGQEAERVEGVDGKLREGFQKEVNRWPTMTSQPRSAPATQPAQQPTLRPTPRPTPRPAPQPAPRPATKSAPRPTPAVQASNHQHHAGHSPHSHGHAHKAPVRQRGPTAAPPMAHQPTNTRNHNEIEMRQHQPVPQPAMRYAAPSTHQHTTHVHPPSTSQIRPNPPPNVYNNNSYTNYSYQENAPPPPIQSNSSSSSYGGLAVGAGLVGGAALGYGAYEAFEDNNETYPEDDYVPADDGPYDEDPNLYPGDDNDPGMYPDDYDNDPNSYAPDNSNTPDGQSYDPDVGAPDVADDSQFKSYDPDTGAPADYGGGGYDDATGGDSDFCGGDNCCGCDSCCECDDCCKCDDCCGDGCCGDGCGDGCCDDGCCNWCGGDDDDSGCCC